MTRLQPNGWRVTGNETHIIELIRPIDKGKFDKEVLIAEKSHRTKNWQFKLFEATPNHERTDTIHEDTFPTATRDDIIRRINDHTRTNPADSY